MLIVLIVLHYMLIILCSKLNTPASLIVTCAITIIMRIYLEKYPVINLFVNTYFAPQIAHHPPHTIYEYACFHYIVRSPMTWRIWAAIIMEQPLPPPPPPPQRRHRWCRASCRSSLASRSRRCAWERWFMHALWWRRWYAPPRKTLISYN